MPGVEHLTAREREVLRCLLRVIKNKAVAAELGLSLNTIESHLKAARGKLGTADSLSAARLLAEAEGAHGYAVTAKPGYPPELGPTINPASEDAPEPPPLWWRAAPLPFAVRGRPWNALGIGWRLLWPLLITFGLVLAAGVLLSGLVALSDLARGHR